MSYSYIDGEALSSHPLYRCWQGIKNRCTNENDERNWKNYGGRGITVCDEWQDNFLAFYQWAISSGWQAGLTIDRIDNDGNYTPTNCRWADWIQQANNRRTNRVITAFGESKTLTQWSKDKRCVVAKDVLRYRLNDGWEAGAAITTLDSHSFTAFNETKSLTEWAEDSRCKVNHNTLSKRISYYGMDVETAITQPLTYWNSNEPLVLREAFGEKKTIDQWTKDKRCAVKRSVVYRRVKDGWELEKALTMPVLPFRDKAKGIYFDKERNKWQAGLGGGEFKHLGRFDTKEEAIAARKEAERKLLERSLKQ